MNWFYWLTSPTSAALPHAPSSVLPVVIQKYVRDLPETMVLSTTVCCSHIEHLTDNL